MSNYSVCFEIERVTGELEYPVFELLGIDRVKSKMNALRLLWGVCKVNINSLYVI
jgi:hypothetical protein